MAECWMNLIQKYDFETAMELDWDAECNRKPIAIMNACPLPCEIQLKYSMQCQLLNGIMKENECIQIVNRN